MTAPLKLDAASPVAFRRVMGAFATGVAVLTTESDGIMHGMTVNSLTSVSLDPSMILVCLRSGSATGGAVRRRGMFGLNILSRRQEHLSRHFCEAEGDRFAGIGLEPDDQGIPFLAGAVAHLRCNLHDVHPAGDHEVVFGRVDHCRVIDEPPLVFLNGRLGSFTQ